MIVEHGLLTIIPGRELDFEAAFAKARPLIESSPGCHGASIARGVENPSVYLFVVRWESVEAHVVGFRESPAYARWRELLHSLYATAPTVEHYAEQ